MTIVDDIITDLQSSDASKRKWVNIIRQTDLFVENEENIAAAAQRAIDLGIANDWWDSTIKPTLVWNNTQSLIDQRATIIIDYNNVKLLLDTETDLFRLFVINQKLKQAEQKFIQIKASL